MTTAPRLKVNRHPRKSSIPYDKDLPICDQYKLVAISTAAHAHIKQVAKLRGTSVIALLSGLVMAIELTE